MQILFLGAPGAGKGTQCKHLVKQLNLPHLSSGDLLREAVKAGTEAGIKAKQYMAEGKLVPDEVLINMFREKLQAPECAPGFILDGFPRNLAQAEALDKLLAELKKDLTVVIDLDVDEKLLMDRLTGRRICSNKTCNQPYHLVNIPPKKDNVCDICGGELYQRNDDKAELVAPRLEEYSKQTKPLIDYYSKRGILKRIDGNGDENQIFSNLMQAVRVPAK
jgi:adenylate kinase